MVFVKILGTIDLAASFSFLMFIFGVPIFTPFILFCAGLLFCKGLFILTGDIFSILDIIAALILLVSIFFTPPSVMLWIPGFFLLAKGVASFI